MYQIYSIDTLKNKSLADLKAIAQPIGAVAADKRSKQSWIDAIVAKQPQPVEQLATEFDVVVDGEAMATPTLLGNAAIEEDEQSVNLPKVGDSHFIGAYFLRCVSVGGEYAAVWDVSIDGAVMGEIRMDWRCFWSHTMSLSTFTTPQEAIADLYDCLQTYRAIAYFSSLGYQVVGVSNQGGCAAGHKSIENAISEMQFTLSLLPQLSCIYFCPDFDGLECWRVEVDSATQVKQYSTTEFGSFRKPGAGMIKVASNRYAVTIDSYMIGDRPEDGECAVNAGIKFFPADVWRKQFDTSTSSVHRCAHRKRYGCGAVAPEADVV